MTQFENIVRKDFLKKISKISANYQNYKTNLVTKFTSTSIWKNNLLKSEFFKELLTKGQFLHSNTFDKKDKKQEKERCFQFATFISKIFSEEKINIQQIFSLVFLQIKINPCVPVLTSFLETGIPGKIGNRYRYLYYILCLETSQKSKFAMKCLYSLFPLVSNYVLFAKECFRFEIYFFKKIFFYNEYFREKRSEKIVQIKSYLDDIFKKSIWCFMSSFFNDILIRILLQISSKEIWFIESIGSIINNVISVLTQRRRFALTQVRTLCLTLLPKIHQIRKNSLAIITIGILRFRPFIPELFDFRILQHKRKFTNIPVFTVKIKTRNKLQDFLINTILFL